MKGKYLKYDHGQEILVGDKDENFFSKNCKGEIKSWLSHDTFEELVAEGGNILVMKYGGVFHCFTDDEVNLLLTSGKDQNGSLVNGDALKIMRYLKKDDDVTDKQINANQKNIDDVIDSVKNMIKRYKNILNSDDKKLVEQTFSLDDRGWEKLKDGSVYEQDESLETLIKNLGIKHQSGNKTKISKDFYDKRVQGSFDEAKFNLLVSSDKMKTYKDNIHKYCKEIIKRLEQIIDELEEFKLSTDPDEHDKEEIKKAIEDFLINPSHFWSIRADYGYPFIEIPSLTLLSNEYEKINSEFGVLVVNGKNFRGNQETLQALRRLL